MKSQAIGVIYVEGTNRDEGVEPRDIRARQPSISNAFLYSLVNMKNEELNRHDQLKLRYMDTIEALRRRWTPGISIPGAFGPVAYYAMEVGKP